MTTTQHLSPAQILKLPGSQNLINELLERIDHDLPDIAEEVAERDGPVLGEAFATSAALWNHYKQAEERALRTIALELYTQLLKKAQR